jgi:hypothetical protein
MSKSVRSDSRDWNEWFVAALLVLLMLIEATDARGWRGRIGLAVRLAALGGAEGSQVGGSPEDDADGDVLAMLAAVGFA